MKRVLVVGLAVIGLAACASKPRTEPPAPVETGGAWGGARAATVAPAPREPETSSVEVYAYRGPEAVVAEGGEPSGAQPAHAGSAPSGGMGSLRVEHSPSEGQAGVPAPQPSQTLAYAPPPQQPALAPAAASLARQAEQQRQTRDYVGAAATLERALRIEPQEAYLWNRLARVRLEQGYQAQAGNLAERSNSLAKDEPGLKRDNWSIIAAARRAAGDTAGAAEAEQKARGG